MNNACEVAKILIREIGLRQGLSYARRKSQMGNHTINREYGDAVDIIEKEIAALQRLDRKTKVA